MKGAATPNVVALVTASSEGLKAPEPEGGGPPSQRLVTLLQLAPAGLYYTLFFLVPIGYLILYSFYSVENFDFVSKLTLSNYRTVWTSDIYRSYLSTTLQLSGITAVLVVAIAFPFSFITTYVFPRRRQLLYFFVLVSLFGGYLVRIYSWRSILGKQGAINEGLLRLHVVDHPVSFLLNSRFAIVLVLTCFLIPLGVLPIFNAMQNVPASLLEASSDLGAGKLRAAWTIVLPLTMRGVSSAFAFTFMASAAEWVTPLLVGGTRDQFVGNQIAFEFGAGYNWPLGAALALSLVFIIVLLVTVVIFSLRRFAR